MIPATPASVPSTPPVLSTLLNNLDVCPRTHTAGRGGHVAVIGCVADASSLDEALRRPGRLDELVVLAPPDLGEREAMMRVLLSRAPLAPDCSIPAAAALLSPPVQSVQAGHAEPASAADVAGVCAAAARAALRRGGPVEHADLAAAALDVWRRARALREASARAYGSV
ncbi:hypothetical protein T484DRAFT_1767752 [Baffinella frigidus]|nr:hypothetical protein T484DRAFT_1767752 [Cryptophyta sp. CCMP2293]